MINKDLHKSLARKKVNDILIGGWNDSGVGIWFWTEFCSYVGVVWVKCYKCWSVWCLTLSNGRMTLGGLMFYCVISFPFELVVGCVRDKACTIHCVYYDLVMHAIVKGGVFEFISCGRLKNGICFWVVPILVWFCCCLQELNDTCKFHKVGPRGGNWTVCIFCTNKSLLSGKWNIPGWSGGVAWGSLEVLGGLSLQSWCGGSMQPWIS